MRKKVFFSYFLTTFYMGNTFALCMMGRDNVIARAGRYKQRHCEGLKVESPVIARRAMPDVATLRLSREQNQACLNYAEAEQGRPKVNLIQQEIPTSLRSSG